MSFQHFDYTFPRSKYITHKFWKGQSDDDSNPTIFANSIWISIHPSFPITAFDNKIDQFERQYEISEKTEASSNICKERRDSIITMSAGNISPPMLTPDKPLKIKSQFSKI